MSALSPTVLPPKLDRRHNNPEIVAEPQLESDEAQTLESPEAVQDEITETDDTPTAEDEPSPECIPGLILNTTRAAMVGFVESRPDEYVARLEVSPVNARRSHRIRYPMS